MFHHRKIQRLMLIVQYSEYIGFVKAMDACRNMKLMIVDDTNTAYTANIKVRFI